MISIAIQIQSESVLYIPSTRGYSSVNKVVGISKKIKLYHSPADRLREVLFWKQYHKDFVVLDNISFEISNGIGNVISNSG